jgi:hypothetical protein
MQFDTRSLPNYLGEVATIQLPADHLFSFEQAGISHRFNKHVGSAFMNIILNF